MGNYRFRLADMMPNAWFYKLKDMGRATRNQSSISHSMKRGYLARVAVPTSPKPYPPQNTPPKQAFLPSRASHYYSSRGGEAEKFMTSPINFKASDTHFPMDPPRKSRRRARGRPARLSTKMVTSPVSASCGCRQWRSAAIADCRGSHAVNYDEDDDLGKPTIAGQLEFDGSPAWPQTCSCRVTSSVTDIIIDMAGKEQDSFKDFDAVSELELPPILTKPAEKKECQPPGSDETKDNAKERSPSTPAARKTPPGIHRVKMRASSPRIASKRLQVNRGRKSSATKQQRRGGLSESFAVVKNSSDPQRDFRDSMLEMIVENNIRASKDLEELLACYLSLNSNEYHDVIVKVFEQIWFDLTDIKIVKQI